MSVHSVLPDAGQAPQPHRKKRGGPLTELQVIARHSIATGNEDQVYALLPQLITAARSEPGNIAFDAYPALGDPSNYVLLERYTSRAAFAEHRQTSHFKEIMLGQILPLLANRTIEQYDVTEDETAAAR
jgi:quinol monooxygenase YgiN